MTSVLTESTRTYELVRTNPHARRLTFELRIVSSTHCQHRKLAVIKSTLENRRLRRFGIQELHFPNRSAHRLVVETTTVANRHTDVNSVRDALYQQLDNVIPTIVGDVDQYIAAKDPCVSDTDAATLMARNSGGTRRHDKKQKRRERNNLRRQRQKFRDNAIAARQAFEDAGLQPVVI